MRHLAVAAVIAERIVLLVSTPAMRRLNAGSGVLVVDPLHEITSVEC